MQDTHDEMEDAGRGGMLSLWQRMCLEGTEFFVDGEEVPLTAALARAVREDGVYMADYVMGETGRIEQVRFDRVKPE